MNRLTSTYDQFEESAREAFRFLEDEYGFKLEKIRRNRYSSVLLYQNATTGIEVECEPREGKIWVMLYRLVNGQLPEYQSVPDLDADTTNRFDLDTLIEFKAPWLLAKSEGPQPIPRHEDMKAAIGVKAVALRRFGQGVLMGDFADFAGLGRIKLERLKKARGS